MAHFRLLAERRGHTLNTTALVNEAYLKLEQQNRVGAAGRDQFLAAASNTMRRILVDHARSRKRKKRGEGKGTVPFDDVEAFLSDSETEEMLELDDALTRLEKVNPLGAEVVQHRFFSGLTLAQTARLQETSVKSVQRRWWAARAWLRKEMSSAAGS